MLGTVSPTTSASSPLSLDVLADWFTPAILVVGGFHFLIFILLRTWAGSDLRSLAQVLERFTDGFHARSRIDWNGHLTDQVDAFVEDIREAAEDPISRKLVAERIKILDEQRKYLDSYRFESVWNVARTGIEAYPLLGVLGTILALWMAMRQNVDGSSAAVGQIVERFGLAIDSTFAGLAMAVLLMLVHSAFETLFHRITENRKNVRDLVGKVKQELVSEPAFDSESN